MNRGKIIGAIVLLVAIGIVVLRLLGGTGSGGSGDTASTPAQAPVAGLAASFSLPADGEVWTYTIDPAETDLHWRIYSGGTFAALGHNHVIAPGTIDGELSVASDLAAAEWSLGFAVNDLVIDDPALRARYGEDFESVPNEEDKAGTKTNMLTEDVLNGQVYPRIELEGRGLNGEPASAEIPVVINMLGRTIEQTFPASVSIDADAVTVTGGLRLTHADLGMEPFSLFGGAIAVGEEIDFTYRIHAVANGQ